MQLNLVHRSYTITPGTYDFDISFLDIDDEEHYFCLFLCGNGYIPCNDRSTSPPSLFRTNTQYRAVVDTAPAQIGVFTHAKNSGRKRVD